VADKIPGVGQLPVVGRLFGSSKSDGKKSEIILSITPHIIRPHISTDASNNDIWSGTESTVRDRALRLDPVGTVRTEGTVTGTGVDGGANRPAPTTGPANPSPGTGATLINPNRPGFTPSGAPEAAAPAAAATGGGATTPPAASAQGTGALSPAAAQPNNPGRTTQGVVPQASTTNVTPLTVVPRTPNSVRPGRALSPAQPSAPAGSPPPPPPPPAEGDATPKE
jgi:general secretion pathway protein D